MISEQREYFRIKDHAWIDYRKVKHDRLSAKAEDCFTAASEFTLTTELQEIEVEASKLMHGLAERDAELANCLRAVNRKIDVLARAIISSVHGEQRVPQEVVISEASIGFQSDTSFKGGQWLALRIMLESEALLLHCYAEVKSCEPDETNSAYTINAEFGWREEEQQDLLAKHIFRQQARQRREQRQG